VLNVARELLESPDVSIDDDFFSVGGDSILAMYLIGELARHTGLRVRVSLLLAHPVLREFCAEIEALGQADPRQPNDSETPLAAALRSVGTNRGGGDAD
jgi:aryl carrier-like protein